MGRRRRAVEELQRQVAAFQQRLEMEAWQKETVLKRLETVESGAAEQSRAVNDQVAGVTARVDDVTALLDANAASSQERLDATAAQLGAVAGRTATLADRIDVLERRAGDDLRVVRQRVDEIATALTRQLDEVASELAAAHKRLDELDAIASAGAAGDLVTSAVTDQLRTNQARMAAELVRSQQAFRDEVAALIASLGPRRRA